MSAPPSPRLLLTNGRVWTGDARRPWAEAVLLAGSEVAAVGGSAELMKLGRQAERVIDVRGAMVLPGFIDAHLHLIPSALRLESVQLRDVSSREAFRSAVHDFARSVPAGEWITGGDWDHTRWGGELPTCDWIDAVTPAHPVFVSRHDGHMALANSLALRLAGVDRGTRDPDGGVIVRDAGGEPTGVLKDTAMPLVMSHVPAPSRELLFAALRRACAYLAERGVTSVHHMGTWEDLEVLRAARASGALCTRTYAAVPMETWPRLADEIASHGDGDDWLRIGGLKAFMDGSLGSHTAAFLEAYADAPGDRGLFTIDPGDLRTWLRGAWSHRLQPIVHAIGDRAVREVLDAMAETHEREDWWVPRIEHAQHVSTSDLPRFREVGVLASVQPYHLADDGRWAERVIGTHRVAEAFPVGSLIRSGAAVAFGSDWFVAPPEPLQAIQAAVTRQTVDGGHPDGWTPGERVTVEEALYAHTVAGAAAERAAGRKGVLTRGALADVVVLDRDLTRTPAAGIAEARILLTVIAGRIVHETSGPW